MVTQPGRIEPDDSSYPPGLHDLEKPPPLWSLGTLSSLPAIAVVGTRRATRYGLDLAVGFGAAIARSGWSTVSGLARGIDAAAHRGCLGLGGHAVAVLGCGVDVCYPRDNRGIYDGILASHGAIVSEYPPGTRPDRWRFPARNLIMAAMSHAVVVVEAGVTGGALITARLAAELGRPVFVVPGDVDRVMSEGCNRLIRDGAHPVFGAADLVEELSLVVGPPRGASRAAPGLPAGGVDVSDLPELWSMTLSESLVELGRLEMAGVVRREGDLVLPA